ncbi:MULTISPECIES: hypothetical protein [Pseudomonas]|uniref:hypothetical protein n=1 Tax=Pseudomonas TaxID=286 RepID=UPI000D6AEABC|nr:MULTISPECIES: hypothetical protein [Pseudomonas]MCD9118065.1 hypothetical protein [Pseudomonas bijieensis]PWJ39813.1 hypothetical protein ATJ40_103405 [Pseudomonas sp. 43mfcvi1.1]WLH62983.1 hypothetical protein PSH86_00070 [Pseudomonas sp. FP2300]SSB95803.1 hypothetical protein SAMN04488697_103405 [Pseudomonas sp. 43mfcvi1.1]
MELSLNAANIPPANTNLTRSDQKLVSNPPADAVKQLAEAGPAAIYHPSEEAQIMVESPVVIETWIGRSQSPDFPRFAAITESAKNTLKSSFETFQTTLSATHPDLAGKKYGFTVEADGKLKVLNTAGQLSSSDTQRLTDLLNESTDLKAAAVAFRDASIDMVDADSPWSGSYLGRYNLTKENFANTIDLAPMLKRPGSVPPQEFSDGLFFNQLAYKGELATRETEAAMFERRAAQRFSAQA